MVLPTFLVDGFVHGSWSVKGASLCLTPFRPLAAADLTAVTEEAERMLPFLGATDLSFTFPNAMAAARQSPRS